VAATGLMPYDTQDMSLTTGFINGITQGFTVNCQTFVCFGELFVPALQRKIKLFGVDTN
jgi:hypothetical protein